MMHAQITQVVRELATDALGAQPRESILLTDGAYRGRGFEVEGASAVWLIDEDRLTVFGTDGSELRVIQQVSAARLPARIAA
jgi:hypothetical protein